ncbi:hypothetical protein TNCV_190521 [Trichonephila clavipes]|nr:hypothetical protein TNCV_190521 [Trichonephila clavipes]
MPSKGCTRLDAGHKGQYLQEVYVPSPVDFFQTQQKGHEKAMESLSANSHVFIIKQRSCACVGGLRMSSPTFLMTVPFVWNYFHNRKTTFGPLVTIELLLVETGQLQTCKRLFISRNH